MSTRTLSAALIAAGAMALAFVATPYISAAAAAAAGHAQLGSFGLDLSGGDPSVKPGDDFARYANGRWLDTAQIPPDRASWGSFAMLRERSLQQVRDILEALPNESPQGSNEQKLHDFYRSYLDTDAIERAGLSSAKAV
ncbi:MAG TPA: M13 family metallopeptidase N-terminal domain-containing protein, partial [Steroidobacteraceae bacterium]